VAPVLLLFHENEWQDDAGVVLIRYFKFQYVIVRIACRCSRCCPVVVPVVVQHHRCVLLKPRVWRALRASPGIGCIKSTSPDRAPIQGSNQVYTVTQGSIRSAPVTLGYCNSHLWCFWAINTAGIGLLQNIFLSEKTCVGADPCVRPRSAARNTIKYTQLRMQDKTHEDVCHAQKKNRELDQIALTVCSNRQTVRQAIITCSMTHES